MLVANINLLWLAIASSALAITVLIIGLAADLTEAECCSAILAGIAACFWAGILIFQASYNTEEKYQILLDRQTRAERTVEKYLIDHPELKVLKNR